LLVRGGVRGVLCLCCWVHKQGRFAGPLLSQSAHVAQLVGQVEPARDDAAVAHDDAAVYVFVL
jgi:hypothetical protein